MGDFSIMGRTKKQIYDFDIGDALAHKYPGIPGICTRAGKITKWPTSVLGPEPTATQQKGLMSSYAAHKLSKVCQERRRREYPPIEDQLDTIYHKGVNAWKKEIKEIKDKYPKDG